MMLLTTALSFAISAASAGPEVTVYNQGFGLIKESRSLTLKAGRQEIGVENVAAQIEPETVSIKLLSGAKFSVLEQNYRYDLISPRAILSKSIGAKVRLIRTIAGQRDVLDGTLLSAPSDVPVDPVTGLQSFPGLVIKANDGRIILDPVGEIEVSEVPSGLISRPTLFWDLEAQAGVANVELSYVTQGISWKSDYVLTLTEGGQSDLQGWVTIDNQSGTSYTDAKIKLLAGEVNRPAPAPQGPGGGGAAFAMEVRKAQSFAEESLFEYHLYTLQRPSTIQNREKKQLSLLEGNGVPYKKRIILDALRQYGRYLPSEGEVGTGKLSPLVKVEFQNDEKSNLGMPLPAGRVRVYQRDKSGSVQLLGEDNIDHTPRNEKVSLNVGRSFDVVGERKRTNFDRLGQNSTRESYTVEVRNRKAVPETVFLIERAWGDWKVTQKSAEFVKLDANAFQFEVKLGPNEVKKVTYTIETRW